MAIPFDSTRVAVAISFVSALAAVAGVPEFREFMCERIGYFCKSLGDDIQSKPATVCTFSGCPMRDGIADDGVQPSQTEISSKPVLNETRTATQASHKSVTKEEAQVTETPKQATKEFLQAHERAEQGNADAQFRLGDMYMYGDGVPKNLDEAIKWFRKAAEQDYVPALKKLYFLSDNISEAEHWRLRASGAQGEVGTLRHDEAGGRTQEQEDEAQRIEEQDAEVIPELF